MRYAIYFSTEAVHPLTRAASVWLGRDAFGEEVPPAIGRQELVEDPARYGFHGTLKAPFDLHKGIDDASLFDAFDEFCAETPAFDIPEIVLGQLGPFFALVPGTGAHEGINALADACVRTFEPFRAQLSEADVARRKPDSLSERQRQYLLEWGYPYVFEEFRFHMTLTGPVRDADRSDVASRLEMHFGAFAGKPLAASHLALFVEPERGAPFKVERIKPLKTA